MGGDEVLRADLHDLQCPCERGPRELPRPFLHVRTQLEMPTSTNQKEDALSTANVPSSQSWTCSLQSVRSSGPTV